MKKNLRAIQFEVRKLANKEIAANLQWFFKTGKGEYGEGDKFLGLKVPQIRKLAKEHRDLNIKEVETLLRSLYHEERMLALFILNHIFKKGSPNIKKEIYKLYLANTKYINNWDLVDSSAWHIVGAYLVDKDRKPLYVLAKSKSLWERRIAIISAFYFIKNDDFKDALKISELLVFDKEDLIRKAVGWMLREIGNRNLVAEENFLKKYYKKMPRTMLRYAIEKFPEQKRHGYLKK